MSLREIAATMTVDTFAVEAQTDVDDTPGEAVDSSAADTALTSASTTDAGTDTVDAPAGSESDTAADAAVVAEKPKKRAGQEGRPEEDQDPRAHPDRHRHRRRRVEGRAQAGQQLHREEPAGRRRGRLPRRQGTARGPVRPDRRGHRRRPRAAGRQGRRPRSRTRSRPQNPGRTGRLVPALPGRAWPGVRPAVSPRPLAELHHHRLRLAGA